MESVTPVLASLPWFAWIALAAIAGSTITGMFKMAITHQERMAMIRQGMNPDQPAAKPYETSEI